MGSASAEKLNEESLGPDDDSSLQDGNPKAKVQRNFPIHSLHAPSDSTPICPWSDFPFLVFVFPIRSDGNNVADCCGTRAGRSFVEWLIGLDCVEDKKDDLTEFVFPILMTVSNSW
ncbi:unnamed protein product [Citrullus colocynthis]|uniref:Uncharacterized protein n=1 Tax=Citrullus colocynthis TaxID=252529 RepID=A0ABP0YBW7_9ROSI